MTNDKLGCVADEPTNILMHAPHALTRLAHLDVHEGGPGDVGDGRAHLLPRVDHVHAKRVHRIAPAQSNTANRERVDKDAF